MFQLMAPGNGWQFMFPFLNLYVASHNSQKPAAGITWDNFKEKKQKRPAGSIYRSSGRGAGDLFLFGSWWLWEVTSSCQQMGWMGWMGSLGIVCAQTCEENTRETYGILCQEYTHQTKKNKLWWYHFLWYTSSFAWYGCWTYFLATVNSAFLSELQLLILPLQIWWVARITYTEFCAAGAGWRWGTSVMDVFLRLENNNPSPFLLYK